MISLGETRNIKVFYLNNSKPKLVLIHIYSVPTSKGKTILYYKDKSMSFKECKIKMKFFMFFLKCGSKESDEKLTAVQHQDNKTAESTQLADSLLITAR
jgi:hypothetical protein